MIFAKTKLKGNFLISLEARKDKRGFFARYFCQEEFKNKKLNTTWVQINTSMSKRIGTLRGLHYQRPPHAEDKLVRCIKGAIWDVVVDLRSGSNTYGKWFGAFLSAKNRTMMYIPKGFAHGFISLQSQTEVLYLVSDFYAPEYEETLIWNDPHVKIAWPLKPNVISEHDSHGSKLSHLKPVKLFKKRNVKY